MNIDLLRQAGGVTRYHTERRLRSQCVAEHSWNVALLALHLCPDARREVIIWALLHDAPEVFTGDVPAPAKWASPLLGEALTALEERAWDDMALPVHDLTDAEGKLLKFCDGAELVLWCLEEMRMGNTYAAAPAGRVLERLSTNEEYHDFYSQLQQEYDDVSKR